MGDDKEIFLMFYLFFELVKLIDWELLVFCNGCVVFFRFWVVCLVWGELCFLIWRDNVWVLVGELGVCEKIVKLFGFFDLEVYSDLCLFFLDGMDLVLVDVVCFILLIW